MSLIDRYIHEVGRHLPRKMRADIQIELRSLLTDTLEDRAGAEASEADIVALLKEFGAPRAVAASYYPDGQYLIGPALYPLFRLVVGIALAAVVSAQLLAWGVSYFIAREPFALLRALVGLLNSLPAAVGMVVIVFMILQWFEVRPRTQEKSWDPADLPQIVVAEPVKRGERVFSIVMGIVALVILLLFRDNVGIVVTLGSDIFVNPVIGQYVVWIGLSLLFGIGLDVYLLWQGEWQTNSRLIKIGVNIFSVIVLFLLVQAHSDWLVARGAAGFFETLSVLPEDIDRGGQIIGMKSFQMAFVVAMVVLTLETLFMLFRLVRVSLSREPRAELAHIRKA